MTWILTEGGSGFRGLGLYSGVLGGLGSLAVLFFWGGGGWVVPGLGWMQVCHSVFLFHGSFGGFGASGFRAMGCTSTDLILIMLLAGAAWGGGAGIQTPQLSFSCTCRCTWRLRKGSGLGSEDFNCSGSPKCCRCR